MSHAETPPQATPGLSSLKLPPRLNVTLGTPAATWTTPTLPSMGIAAALDPPRTMFEVDAGFTGHNHNYERTHAVRNLTVVSRGRRVEDPFGDFFTVYDRPGAPLHWVVGTGGADPNPVGSWRNETGCPTWVARRLYDDAEDEPNNWGWARVRATKEEMAIAFIDSTRNRTLDRVVLRK